MKELDVLLERFLADGFDDLDAAGLDTLAALLEHPDQDVLAWLTADAAPPEPRLAGIVATIRASAVGRRV